MQTPPNARQIPIGWERRIRQYLDAGTGLAQLAAGHGISERTARKWLARFRSDGPVALADRRSVRLSQRRTLDPQPQQQAVELRHQRCTLRKIARPLLVPIANLALAMRPLGLIRLRNIDPQHLRFCEAVSTGAALPVGEAGRHDPCRHLAAAFSEGVATGPL
jgi:transposase-like protein